MNYNDAGFPKMTWSIRQAIKGIWFHTYIAFFLRFSGFFLLGLIAYLHFLFDSINQNQAAIGLWIIVYLGYLVFLEFIRFRKLPYYDSNGLILFRIFSHLVLVSWLLNVAPLMRSLLAFAFLVPFISTIVYYPQNQKLQAFVYASSILGIIIGSIILEPNNPLTFWQVVVIAIALGIMLISVKQIHRILSVPKAMSDIITRLKGTLDLTDALGQIGEGALMITEADGLFVLIVDPEDRSYITHKVIGLNLSPSFKMKDLITKCDAIQNGQRYEKDDLENSADKQYFQQFFSPPPRAILVEPICGSTMSIFGLIMVGSTNPAEFDEVKKKNFQTFTESASVAVETSLLYRKARLSLSGQKSAAEQLLEAEEEPEIEKILIVQAVELIANADESVLHRYESELGYLIPQAGLKSSETGEPVLWGELSNNPNRLGKSIMKIGEGIAGSALIRGEVISSSEVGKHPRFVNVNRQVTFTSLMSAPIINPINNLPLGTLSVHSKKRDAFTIEDQSSLLSLAKQGAISFAREQEAKEWRLRGGILKEIFESALLINYEENEHHVAQQLAKIAVEVLPFHMVRIRLYDPVTKNLVCVAVSGYPQNDKQKLIGEHLPLAELEKFLNPEYSEERSYLIPSDAPGWRDFAEKYLYIPKDNIVENATWDKYDAFFTPLLSENGDLLGYIAWDQPENNLRPPKRIVEAVGAFASMAGWSIDLVRAYRRITEQRELIVSLIASTTDQMASTSNSNIMNEVAVNIGRERLHTEACSLYLVIENALELTSSTYLKNTNYYRRRKQIKAEVGSGLTSWVAAIKRPLYFNSESEYNSHPGWAGETDQLQHLPSGACKNLLLVPIISYIGDCVGVLSFENKLDREGIVNFFDADVKTAMNLANELGLSLSLAEQLKNARTIEKQMLEDDLHELKNHYYYGVQTLADTALYWLRQKKYKNTEVRLENLAKNSLTILNELYGLHNTVQRKYYEIENFRLALNLLTDTVLKLYSLDDQSYKNERARIKISYGKDINLSPMLRYTFIRITSGALMNSIKHSGFLENTSIEINITVSQVDDYVRLIITDNGRGAQKIKPGYGISRMRDLVRFMKSKRFDIKLSITPKDGEGTEVRLISKLLPLEA